MNYNFTTLNDREFEQIAKDLLNAKFNLQLQDFKVGKDKGIDLRFSTRINNNSIIVQAKHYIGSEFAQLKHKLLKIEFDKIQKLKPDRYIIVTSLPLSASQKDELKAGLAPFVLTSNDIIGQEDLNSYLGEFKEVEKRYFKLWFSSINVFNTVLNNAVEGRTRYLMEKINSKIPFYVVTNKLDEANKILKKEKLILITGQPGVGKTTLAEIILFERAKYGCKIYKVENIREAEDVISPNNDELQLFYFDDFLGANYYEIVNTQKTETQLTSFVERVKNTPNKYLVLTTRTVVLNQSIDSCEKIRHSKLANNQFEIKLTDYTNYEKALILYNHLFFRKIREDLHDSILYNKFYRKIIQHKNYTPRIIEFITDTAKIQELTPETYPEFILNNLNDPKDIWSHSFNNQIKYLDRCLLLTLFTFEDSPSESSFFAAYQNRLEYEKIVNNQIITANQFNESIRVLLNGFIASNLYNDTPEIREFSFINPSLTDFLINYVATSFAERKSIISSILYFEQLERFDPNKSLINFEKELQNIIRQKISQTEIKVNETNDISYSNNEKHAIILETLCKYCHEVDVDALLLEYFQQISYTESWRYILQKIEYFLLNIGDAPKTYNYIKDNFIEIIEKMMSHIHDFNNARQIPKLFEKYGHNYPEYMKTDKGHETIIYMIDNIWQEIEEQLVRDRENGINSMDEVEELYYEINYLVSELIDELFLNTCSVSGFGTGIDINYWMEKIEENQEKMEKEKLRNDDDFDDYYYNKNSGTNEDILIDDLFEKYE